jgi:hypothetical protein
MADKVHKYKLGQRVQFSAPESRGQFRSSARYTVTRLLPRVGNNVSYRIKSDTEAHERVADEAELEASF